ncbi:MAG: hypothetical protein AAF487_12070 [Bacteroidota bacterium]
MKNHWLITVICGLSFAALSAIQINTHIIMPAIWRNISDTLILALAVAVPQLILVKYGKPAANYWVLVKHGIFSFLIYVFGIILYLLFFEEGSFSNAFMGIVLVIGCAFVFSLFSALLFNRIKSSSKDFYSDILDDELSRREGEEE